METIIKLLRGTTRAGIFFAADKLRMSMTRKSATPAQCSLIHGEDSFI